MDEKLDPRYDPQYQRGFAGDAAFAPSRPLGARPTEPQRVASRPTPIAPDAVDAPAQERRLETPAAVAIPVLVERPLSANPMIWLLAVVGCALIVAGIVSFAAQTSVATASEATAINYSLLQFLIQVTPVLLALGSATLLGLGFVVALDRQRRTRTVVEDDGR